MEWIGCGSEHGHTSWIGLDWVSEFVDLIGLDLAKWGPTHAQLCECQTTSSICNHPTLQGRFVIVAPSIN